MQIKAAERLSTIEALKEVVVFLAALTFSTAIEKFVKGGISSANAADKLREAVCLIFLTVGVVRFYLGNYRLLDNSYKISPVTAAQGRRNILWFDFSCVLLAALGFAILSNYLTDFTKFVTIYAGIILLDIFWLGATTKKLPVVFSSNWTIALEFDGYTWFWNNFGHLIGISLFIVLSLSASVVWPDIEILGSIQQGVRHWNLQGSDWLFWGTSLLLLTNAVVDLYFTRNLYFPREVDPGDFNWQAQHSIFLAAPLTQSLVRSGEAMTLPGAYREVLRTIIKVFEDRRWTVFNAHKREGWGEHLFSPVDALNHDMEEIRKSDLIVAILGSPPSPGVQLEIGYAVSLKKPIVILHAKDQQTPYLVEGLHSVAPTKIIPYDDEATIAELLDKNLFQEGGSRTASANPTWP